MRFYVTNQSEDEYKLIRQQGTMVLLSDNGHTAKRIGFDRYVSKLHKNQRLDIKLKHLEMICKSLNIIKDAPGAIIATIEAIILITLLLAKLL